jgi:hypothetical protein
VPAAKGRSPKPAAKTPGAAAVDAYLAQQPADKRALLQELRKLVDAALPDASASIKWGVPIYQVNDRNVCALASFKDCVAINIFASPDRLADPKKKLEGAGKTSRMLKVRTAKDIDAASIQRWLKAASAASR